MARTKVAIRSRGLCRDAINFIVLFHVHQRLWVFRAIQKIDAVNDTIFRDRIEARYRARRAIGPPPSPALRI